MRTYLLRAAVNVRGFFTALTPNGRVALGLAVVGALVGSLLDWPELLVIAAAAALALTLSAVSVLGSGRFTVQRVLHPARLRPGDEAIGLLTVRNLGRRRRRIIRAIDRVGDKQVPMDIPPIESGDSVDVPFGVLGERRGVIEVGPLFIGRADPFGLMRRRHAEGEVLEVIVHPRTVPVSVSGSGWAKDLEGPTTQDSPLGSVAFHSLRDYQPGDDRRHIHGRSSARAGRPIVRQFVDTRRSSNLVVLDRRLERYETPDLAEHAIEIAASLTVSMMALGQPTVIELGDGRHPADRSTLVLDRLARLEFGGHQDLAALVANAVDRNGAPTTLVLISGAGTTAAELGRARAAVNRAADVSVITVGSGTGTVMEERGGRSTLRVSSLDEFRHLWAAVGLARRR